VQVQTQFLGHLGRFGLSVHECLPLAHHIMPIGLDLIITANYSNLMAEFRLFESLKIQTQKKTVNEP
jgi:hypothetical protein